MSIGCRLYQTLIVVLTRQDQLPSARKRMDEQTSRARNVEKGPGLLVQYSNVRPAVAFDGNHSAIYLGNDGMRGIMSFTASK
jgi:hypothetical protein